MSVLVEMQVYVITHRAFPNRFVWASSIQKAHEFAKGLYPADSFSVRSPLPKEWDSLHT